MSSSRASPFGWRLLLAAMEWIPQATLSRAAGRLADLRLPRPLRRPVLGGFARLVGMDLAEAERPLRAYGSINELFVRRLRSGTRSWPEGSLAAGSPVDAVCGQFGTLEDGRLFQVKGRPYSAAELLDEPGEAEHFTGGAYVTLYLTPRHYHRIHAPTGGTVRRARHVPGALFPVNDHAVRHVSRLFARNERLVCYLDGPLGRVAVVAVGAYNVGRISARFDPQWNRGVHTRAVTNRPGARPVSRTYDPPVSVERGEELMAFHLGSTVVLLFQPGRAVLIPSLRSGAEVRLGQRIADPPVAQSHSG